MNDKRLIGSVLGLSAGVISLAFGAEGRQLAVGLANGQVDSALGLDMRVGLAFEVDFRIGMGLRSVITAGRGVGVDGRRVEVETTIGMRVEIGVLLRLGIGIGLEYGYGQGWRYG